jgi:glycosyltransferase involved in cell wall biosynthesis
MIVNIVTVVFNDVEHIESTIQSVIQQRRNRFDLKINYFIIDGGSNDGTLEIIERYNNDIDKWISEKDRGIYDAMNKGLRMISDGYILYLGAGDKIISLPKLQLLNSKIEAICGNVIINEKSLFKSNTSKGLRLGNSLHHQALLIHKSMLQSKEFNTNYKVYADYDLNIRLLKSGIDFQYSSDLLSYQMPGGITKKVYMSEMVEIARQNFGFGTSICTTLYLCFAQAREILKTGNNNFTWNQP